jgi:LysM repeat protein
VAAGETLWSIAQRYGVSVDQVKSWNGRRGNKVGIGEVLRIYASAGSPRT